MVIGYIYKIYDNTNGSVYYGSTKNKISQRIAIHRNDYKMWVDGRRLNECKSFEILKNGDYAYSLVEQVEYEDKLVLHQRERWYIENNECVNKNVPTRTIQEYYIENRETLIAYQHKHREENRDELNAKKKTYYQENRDEIIAKKIEYYQDHKDEINAKKREQFKDRDKQVFNAKAKEYRLKKKAEKEASNLI